MKFRVLTTMVLAVPAFLLVLALAQDGSSKAKEDAKAAADRKVFDDIAIQEKNLAAKVRAFEEQILRLTRRLELSDKVEEQERAKNLRSALEKSQIESVALKLDKISDMVKRGRFESLDPFQQLAEDSEKVAKILKDIRDILDQDSSSRRRREQMELVKEWLKQIEKSLSDEKQNNQLNRAGKTDQKELESSEKHNGDSLQKLLDKMAGKDQKGDKSGQGSQAKDKKGEPKDGGKSAGKDGGEAKGEDKNGESKKGQAKEGMAKESKEGKPPEKGGVKTLKKEEPKTAAAKAGKGQENKPAGAKEAKGGAENPKGSPAEAKSGGAEAKKGEAKSDSKGQSSAKSSGQSPQQPPQDPPQASQKGDNQPPQAQKSQDDPKDNIANSRKRVEEAYDKIRQAQEKFAKEQTKEAGPDQKVAIQKLDEARKKLEDLLNQLREEELEKLLVALIHRLERMLALEIDVLNGTTSLHASIQATTTKKITDSNRQESSKLSDKQRDLGIEAQQAIDLLEGEGSGVAFPEVFQEVRQDMKHVQDRLDISDVGPVTQGIETDIVSTLKEMIAALKKKDQDMQNKKNPPGGGSPPPPSQQDQKLLDQIAELKMIRSMQKRVNDRTKTYGRLAADEYAVDPNVQKEVQNLSDRQNRIFEITQSIAKGDNK